MADTPKENVFCSEYDGMLIFNSENGSEYGIYLFDKTEEELKEICKIIPECDEVYLETEDISSVKDLEFKGGAKVYMAGTEPLPENIDFSNCSEVHLGGRDLSKIPPQKLRENSVFSYFPQTKFGLHITVMPPLANNIDFSRCSSVTVNADLSNLKEMKFKDGAAVDLSGSTNLPENTDVSNCSSVDLSGCDLGTIKNLGFCDGASVSLAYCKNVPQDIDISRYSAVNLSGIDLAEINNLNFADNADVVLKKCENIPENLDISRCRSINLSKCDLSNVKNLNFKEGARVTLSGAKLPDNTDFSECDEVDLSGCDLSNIKNLKFKKGAKVNLSGCTNIPENLDISECSEVNLSECDLSHINELKLSDGVKLNLEKSQLPKNIDFAKCAELNLSDCDLSQVSDIKFAEGSKVNLQGCRNIPHNLDVSMCKEVWLIPRQFDKVNIGNANVVIGGIALEKIDFSKLKNFSVEGVVQDQILGNSYLSLIGTKEFIFCNEEQYREFTEKGGKVPDGCKVSYSDEAVKKKIREDSQKAHAVLRKKQHQAEHNSPERRDLKSEMRRKPVFDQTKRNLSPEKIVEPNNSIRIAKPLIFEKIKRQNG